MTDRIYLYDSTLRDGAQTQGVDFSAVDKQEIAQQIDELGIDYIEGGFPGANPTDDKFFADIPELKKSRMVAFGMTCRPSNAAKDDAGLNKLIASGVKNICIVGKASAFHVTDALGIELDKNVEMVADSIKYLSENVDEVMLDAEHFFDGYKENPDYAVKIAKIAYDAGARWVVLCDTNGGTLPHEIAEIVREVVKIIPGENLAIHCHNDTDNAVANSIAAVRAGVRQVQGTIGGYGERCGNANLITLIPTLKLKMGFDVGISDEGLKNLSRIAHSLDDRLNRPRYRHAAYVGASAFAHKGGLHASAVLKNSNAYEHVDPEMVGNDRLILVSDQAGRSNIIKRLQDIGLEINANDGDVKEKINALIDEIKKREQMGYAYDSADASFELLARNFLGDEISFFTIKNFRVIDERRWNAKGELVTFSEAKVKMVLDGEEFTEIEEGNGPVNALSKALKKGLSKKYSSINNIKLTDYKVRIMKPEKGTEAITRVEIESEDQTGQRWQTVGVSENIIDASYNALYDSYIYKLMKG